MKASFFKSNRDRLQRSVKNQLIVMAGHSLMQRSNDAAFPFEQEANFWYLTGIESPGWKLVIDASASWLIAPEVDDVHRVFDGELSNEEAKKVSGIQKVLSSVEGQELLTELSKQYSTAVTIGKDPRAKQYDFELNQAPLSLHRNLKKQFKQVEDCRLVLAKLRAIKQPEEIQAIRRAIEITIEAFNKVKSHFQDFTHEYEIEAEFTHHFRGTGAKGHAYDPIVAAGNHARTLHYTANDGAIKKNELVLLDVGARSEGYAADITRTYQFGTASKRQKAVHGAVESAHQEIIALLRPGLSIESYQTKVDEIMKSRLDQLGLLKKPEDYRIYFPHSISHGLGVDVHDGLGRPKKFEEGMVLTVEPGIYIPEEGIGVRIEDDILITKNGHENLSAGLATSL